jgi:hypothetical protein
MFYIVTTEADDRVVENAVNAIRSGEGAIPGPNGNYKFVTPSATHTEGDGGTSSSTLVIVGHASANALSRCATWGRYREEIGERVDWREPTRVYIAACSTAGEGGRKFLHGSIASEIAKSFPAATVWASSTNVGSRTQAGDWQIVT